MDRLFRTWISEMLAKWRQAQPFHLTARRAAIMSRLCNAIVVCGQLALLAGLEQGHIGNALLLKRMN